MNNEERFKENLQNLVNSKEFPFDEKHWESTRKFIDEKRKDQRNRWMYFSIGALLVIGTSFTAIELNRGSRKEVAVTSPVPVTAAQPEVLGTITSENKTTENSAPALTQNNSPAKKAKVKDQTAKTFANSDVKESPVANSPMVNEPIAQPAAASVKLNKTKKAPEVVSRNEDVPVETGTNENGSSRSKKDNKVIPVPPAITNTKETPPATKTETEKTDPTPVVIAPVKEPKTQEQVVAKEEPVAVEQKTEPVVITTPETEKPVENKPEDLAVTATPSAEVKNSVPVQATIPLTEEPKEIMWAVEGGVSYMFGWKGVETSDAMGFNPVFGIHYYDYLTKKLSVSFGGQYNRVSNLSNSSVTSKVTKYSLGEQSNVTVITPERLHYITIPLRVHYDLDSKNNIGFGYSISYLLNVEAKVEKYTVNMGQRSDESSYTTAGYTEGFKLFDSQLSLFYKRRLYKNLALKAELFYGLTDIKDNNFFNVDVFERNKGIKLMVVYDIFRK